MARGIFKRDGLKHIDAISVHPYRGEEPETVVEDYKKLRDLLAKYTSKKIHIISGEWGYAMEKLSDQKLAERRQAEYLARMLLVNSWMDIPISIWYNLKNNGNDLENREYNYGVVWNDLRHKMAFNAIDTLSSVLDGYKFAEKMKFGGSTDYILKFINVKGQQAITFWTIGQEHHINLRIPAGEGELVSMLGKVDKVEWEDNKLNLNLTSSPSYLVIN
ncbi:hypothetical protein ACFQDF_08945 [Ectobacillus funiculus]